MTDTLAAPVKGVINAFNKGITLNQRICRAARNGAAAQMLDTLEQAQILEKALQKCEVRVRDAYAQSTHDFGRKFGEEILNDCLLHGSVYREKY
jgi:hypothetical protein